MLFLWTVTNQGIAQGCIGVRNCPLSALMGSDFQSGFLGADQWQWLVGFRWYESKRAYVEDHEQPDQYGRMVNEVYSLDVAATYGITPRWSATMDIPFTHATRSSYYEHDLVSQHSMSASGIGDIRLTTDFWLLDPHEHMDGNLALGAGFVAPTGNHDATDTAYRSTGPVTRPVDSSIQPGTGGWGIILQLQAYQEIHGNLFAYLNGSYTFTPAEQNDTEYPLADRPLTAAFLTPLQTHNSIADQYLGRAGLSYVLWPEQGLTLSLGARMEGVPVYDAIGASMGFRRPGYTVSVEPSIAWNYKNNSLTVTAPVAVYRNRLQSAPEAKLNRSPGDAAFADYSILATFAHRF